MPLNPKIRALKSIWGVGVLVVLSGPLALWLRGYEPPWPENLSGFQATVSMTFSVVGVLLAITLKRSAKTRKWLATITLLLGLSLLASYLWLTVQYVMPVPQKRDQVEQTARFVVGTVLLPNVETNLNNEDLLRRYGSPDRIWTKASLSPPRFLLSITFCGAFFFLNLGLGLLATGRQNATTAGAAATVVILLVGCGLGGAGCIQMQWGGPIEYTNSIVDNLTPQLVENAKAAYPILGMFIGVGNYGKNAHVQETPAHAQSLSALLFREIFYRADFLRITNSIEPDAEPGSIRDPASNGLILMANLSVTNKEEARCVRYFLSKFHCPTEQLFGCPPDPTKAAKRQIPVLGDGARVNRQCILDAITWFCQEMSLELEMEKSETPLLFVFYISAHGGVSDDGRLYLLPADAVKSDPNTWIYYDDILNPLYHAMNEAFPDPPHHLLIVIDACQDGTGRAVRPLPPIPANVTLVQSASPGQWAWHWTSSNRLTNIVGEQHNYGFPFPPKKMKSSTNINDIAMSVLPIAAHRALEVAVEDKQTQADHRIGVRTWLMMTTNLVQTFLATIPDPDARQTVQISWSGDPDADFSFFVPN
jgi:hypothetical protein